MNLPEIIDNEALKDIVGSKKLALICSKNWKDNGKIEKIPSLSLSSFKQVVLVPSGEPESKSLDKISQELDPDLDGLVALGGGSSIDSAKMLAILKAEKSYCTDYEFNKKKITKKLMPVIAIPTTSGSGSESSMYAVINNSQTHRKFTITHNSIVPSKVLLYPELTIDLPRRITISAGMDAFIQAFEAFFTKDSNPISAYLAPTVMSSILKNLSYVIKNPGDLQARKSMQKSSFLSGICINYSRTGLIHTISMALSEYYSNLHGELNTIIMPYVIKYNKNYYNPPKEEMNFLLTMSGFESLNSFLDYVISYCQELSLVPTQNKIPDKERMIKRIFQDSELYSVNPREINEIELLKIIECVIE